MTTRTRGAPTTIAALIAGCGGGAALLATLPFVAPIGGFWQSIDAADPTATMSFSTPGGQNNLYGGTTASYPVVLNSASSACGAPRTDLNLVGRFDGQSFTLGQTGAATSCLSGNFVDEMTIVLATGGAGTRFRNQLGLQPQFEQGVWVNIDRTTQRLRFRNDAATANGVTTQSGCEFDGSTLSGSVVVAFRQANPTLGQLLAIDSITITRSGGTETWTNGSLYGVSGLAIHAGGSTVSLERHNESPAC